MSDPPTVTGLSPIEGVPGTKVTVRGENLGRNLQDLLGKYSFIDLFIFIIYFIDLFSVFIDRIYNVRDYFSILFNREDFTAIELIF